MHHNIVFGSIHTVTWCIPMRIQWVIKDISIVCIPFKKVMVGFVSYRYALIGWEVVISLDDFRLVWSLTILLRSYTSLSFFFLLFFFSSFDNILISGHLFLREEDM